MPSLPPIVAGDNKYLWGLASFLFFVGLYAATNSMHWQELYVLLPSALDAAIPLLPDTVWVYSSYVAISLAAYIIESDRTILSRFVYAQFGANMLSAAIFLIWPTTFPRPDLPASDDLSAAALHFVWLIDEPVNCFPSLHVSSSMLSALMMWRRGGRLRIIFTLWAFAIAISTMTTKQHHVLDVVGGAALATLLYWIFFICLEIRSRSSEVAVEP